jgi:hypothetical protein
MGKTAVDRRSVSSSFLYSGTLAMFEARGFERTRRLGNNHWVVGRVVAQALSNRGA